MRPSKHNRKTLNSHCSLYGAKMNRHCRCVLSLPFAISAKNASWMYLITPSSSNAIASELILAGQRKPTRDSSKIGWYVCTRYLYHVYKKKFN